MTHCCIIGGGVIGLSIARELAGRGCSVRVLDRDPRRASSSWAAAGILPPAPWHAECTPNEALTAWSDQLHRTWAEELRDETGIDTGLRTCGGLHLATTAAELEERQTEAAAWRATGAACELLDAADVADREPALATAVEEGTILGGYLLPEETQLRSPRHLEALARSCVGRGVMISAGAEVGDMLRDGDRVAGVSATVDGSPEIIRADWYVLAAGAWSERLAATLGVTLATRPIRGQIALVRLPRPRLARVVNRGLDYLVPRDDGRLLIGSTLEDAGFDRRTTPDAIASLFAFGEALLGDLGCGAIEKSWAGLRPGSPDGLPTIGRVPAVDNAIIATGHYRAGLHQSTGTALLVADLISGTSGHPNPVDAAAFRPDRAVRDTAVRRRRA
jgi:glycine oxidase